MKACIPTALVYESVYSYRSGNVATDHILFVASGAFSACKPSDLLAELQVTLTLSLPQLCYHHYAHPTVMLSPCYAGPPVLSP
eukprot:1369011-Amorphochlora_amoeboformis.AAC.2